MLGSEEHVLWPGIELGAGHTPSPSLSDSCVHPLYRSVVLKRGVTRVHGGSRSLGSFDCVTFSLLWPQDLDEGPAVEVSVGGAPCFCAVSRAWP